MTSLKLEKSEKCFGGWQLIYSHESVETKCRMRFSVYLPPQTHAECALGESGSQSAVRRPVLYWLSGLTCTEENFIIKSGFQRHAAAHGLVVVGPDTSPRGLGVPGESDSWDFGVAAGFYLDATQSPWDTNWRMYSYVTQELPKLVNTHFPVMADRAGVFGHSMGGHGALSVFLKNADKYVSCSAFSPISNPSESNWGCNAFKRYLGPVEQHRSSWLQYDSCALARAYSGRRVQLLVEQGEADEWEVDGKRELRADAFEAACACNPNVELTLRRQPGYKHGFFFVSTFLGDHFDWHAKQLLASS